MTASPETAVIAYCSFCLKPHTDVTRMVAGPGVYICNECVALCGELIAMPQQSTDPPPRVAPWEHDVPLDDILASLPRVAAAGRQAEEHLTHWVRKARSMGATWARIGAALDMTRQSAWERFSGEE
ncbi:MAG: ClpX C4-type zinc finger protein [Streptosporangiaceae bacterium]